LLINVHFELIKESFENDTGFITENLAATATQHQYSLLDISALQG